MPRWLRISFKILGSIAAIIVLLWLGMAWYITANKETIRQKIMTTLSDNMGGDLTIGALEPSIWKSFPDISVSLRDVVIRDSLYAHHHHSLLEAKTVFVKLNTLRLIGRKVDIKKITAANGAIFLYTDSTGYSNTYLLQKKDSTKRKKKLLLEAFALENITFTFRHEVKNKDFIILIKNLDGYTTVAGQTNQFHIRTQAHTTAVAFNTTKGSYLKNQDLDINALLLYDTKTKQLHIPEQQITIGREPILFSANFYFNQSPTPFNIRVRSLSADFKTAVSWLSDNIANKLRAYDFKKRLSVDANISGVMQYRTIPLVVVKYSTRDNELETALGNVSGLSFTGYFYNEVVVGKGHWDDNSRIQFNKVSGTWNNIPFTSDTISVTNLITPKLNLFLRSQFDVTNLNQVITGNELRIDKGSAIADLHYTGGILAGDTTPYAINGYLQVKDAAITYMPRNFPLRDIQAKLVFAADDLFFRDVSLRTNKSSITMNGEGRHFLSQYFTDPRKIIIQWRASSKKIDLNDFIAFAGKPGGGVTTKGKIKTRIGTQLDSVLYYSTIKIDANLDQLVYDHFLATRVNANASLAQSGILVENVSLQHAGGTIRLKGSILPSEKGNPFHMNADIDNVDLAGLFKGMDNFNQDGITAANLDGKIAAGVHISGHLTEAGKLIKHTTEGSASFTIRDGALNDFPPFIKLGKFLFRNRHLEHVTFSNIHNTLDFKAGKVIIPPMTIASSAVDMKIQGIYGLDGGTDISMAIPLRNPKKDELNDMGQPIVRTDKGIVLYLRASDDDKKGVKIAWDPLKKGKKATQDSLVRQHGK